MNDIKRLENLQHFYIIKEILYNVFGRRALKGYPLGVDDPDYSVLCFTVMWGNFYHSLSNIDFEI